MKPATFASVFFAVVALALGAAASSSSSDTGSTTYTVPAGVKITVMPATWDWTDDIPACSNWPNTPPVLPCVVEIHAVAVDNQGAESTAVQRWLYETYSPPTPTPTPAPSPSPTATPCRRFLPNGRCKK